jgi:anti-sigma factor RsiW
VIRQLDNYAVLLLYLADELSPGEREVVSQRLAADEQLRAELAQLAQTHDLISASLARMDAAPLHGESAAERRLGEMMRRRILELRAARLPGRSASRIGSTRFPVWAYPAAAAAFIAIGTVAIWGLRPDKRVVTPANNPSRWQFSGVNSPSKMLASEIQVDSADADGLAANFEAGNPMESDQSIESLEAAEEQIAELDQTPSQDVPLYFGFRDEP